MQSSSYELSPPVANSVYVKKKNVYVKNSFDYIKNNDSSGVRCWSSFDPSLKCFACHNEEL